MRTRRQDIGYKWEYDLVRRFNKLGTARRLGGSSTGLPDILYTCHVHDKTDQSNYIYAIEAKATSEANLLYIPNDQIIRCFDILDMFKAYDFRSILFAFKFGGTKLNRRNVKEYIFEVDVVSPLPLKSREKRMKKIREVLRKTEFIRCNYNGCVTDDKHNMLDLDYFL